MNNTPTNKFEVWVFNMFKYVPEHLWPKELVLPDDEFNVVTNFGTNNCFISLKGPIKLWKASEYGLELKYKSQIDDLQARLTKLESK